MSKSEGDVIAMRLNWWYLSFFMRNVLSISYACNEKNVFYVHKVHRPAAFMVKDSTVFLSKSYKFRFFFNLKKHIPRQGHRFLLIPIP